MRARAPIAAALALASATPVAAQGWRDIATAEDRRRLRGWRDAWMAALPQAERAGGGAAIAAERALFDPDRAIDGPVPPAGDYRCRTFKLGSQREGGSGFTVFAAFPCRVEADGGFAKLGGSQRPVGVIHPHTTGRAVFLGVMVLGDERRPMAHGRDGARDLAGWVERVGERRWRLALPYPPFESLLDVIELTPDSVGTTGGGKTLGRGAAAVAGSGGSAAK